GVDDCRSVELREAGTDLRAVRAVGGWRIFARARCDGTAQNAEGHRAKQSDVPHAASLPGRHQKSASSGCGAEVGGYSAVTVEGPVVVPSSFVHASFERRRS